MKAMEIEAVLELICDHYCKYPCKLDQAELDHVCNECNIEKHIRRLAGGKNAEEG